MITVVRAGFDGPRILRHREAFRHHRAFMIAEDRGVGRAAPRPSSGRPEAKQRPGRAEGYPWFLVGNVVYPSATEHHLSTDTERGPTPCTLTRTSSSVASSSASWWG